MRIPGNESGVCFFKTTIAKICILSTYFRDIFKLFSYLLPENMYYNIDITTKNKHTERTEERGSKKGTVRWCITYVFHRRTPIKKEDSL